MLLCRSGGTGRRARLKLVCLRACGFDSHLRYKFYITQYSSIVLKEKIKPYHINKQQKYDIAYLKMAAEWAELSNCERKKVGALIVKDRMIISDGYNGTPSGFDNCCEDENGETKWYVLHAEANAILKVANSTNSCDGSTLYLTLSPCRECAKLIHQSGIKRLVYIKKYKDDAGLRFLKKAGIELSQIESGSFEKSK